MSTFSKQKPSAMEHYTYLCMRVRIGAPRILTRLDAALVGLGVSSSNFLKRYLHFMFDSTMKKPTMKKKMRMTTAD